MTSAAVEWAGWNCINTRTSKKIGMKWNCLYFRVSSAEFIRPVVHPRHPVQSQKNGTPCKKKRAFSEEATASQTVGTIPTRNKHLHEL